MADNLNEKLQKVIDIECEYADRDGSSRFRTCDHYNWDKDIWRYRHQIVDAIRGRGYIVTVTSSFDLTCITTTKKLNLR